MLRTICDMFRYKCAIFRKHNTTGLKPTASYWFCYHVTGSAADINTRTGHLYNKVRKHIASPKICSSFRRGSLCRERVE